MELGLRDKVAIVTGGGGGIGLGIAERLSKEGASVVVADVDIDKASRSVKRIRSHKADRVIPLQVDVADRESVSRMVEEAHRAFAAIHILVNNVGLTQANWIQDITDEDFEKTANINMKGYLNCTQAVIPYMKEAKYGRLIYMGSGSGLKASAGLALYSGSKYFARGLAISAGLELGKHNITANVICPADIYPDDDYATGSWNADGLVDVSLEKEGVKSLADLKTKRMEANPMRRTCRVEDVADLAIFLASERAGFINAQSIGVNGGNIPT